MADFKWGTGWSSATTLLTTDLNSLGNSTISAASAAVNNTSNKDQYAFFEVILASLTPTGAAYVGVYMTKSLDATNYEDAPISGGSQRNTLVAAIPLSTSTSAKRVMSESPILLPPYNVKFYLDNRSGVAFAASGNSLLMYIGNAAY